jgi:transglutaminase-like putative cysteine protease
MVKLGIGISLQYEVATDSRFIFRFHPAQTAQQDVCGEVLSVSQPARAELADADGHGQRELRVAAAPGTLNIEYSAIVGIEHRLADPMRLDEVPVPHLPDAVRPYLQSSPLCPVDSMLAVATKAFGRLPQGYRRIQAICEWVRERTAFTPGGSPGATAQEVLFERQGDSQAFAHLMISLCRALDIPARLVTGIRYGNGSGFRLGASAFHSHVEAFVGERWYLFDPTGLSPAMGLLRIATVRDASEGAIATIRGSALADTSWLSIATLSDEADGGVMPVPLPFAVSTAQASRPATPGNRHMACRQAIPMSRSAAGMLAALHPVATAA